MLLTSARMDVYVGLCISSSLPPKLADIFPVTGSDFAGESLALESARVASRLLNATPIPGLRLPRSNVHFGDRWQPAGTRSAPHSSSVSASGGTCVDPSAFNFSAGVKAAYQELRVFGSNACAGSALASRQQVASIRHMPTTWAVTTKRRTRPTHTELQCFPDLAFDPDRAEAEDLVQGRRFLRYGDYLQGKGLLCKGWTGKGAHF